MKFYTIETFIEKLNKLKQKHQNNYENTENKIMIKTQEEPAGLLKDKEPDLSEQSLNERLTRVTFVKNMFDKSLDEAASSTKDGKIHDLWITIVKHYQFREYFNFDYLYNILINYRDYCVYIGNEIHNPLVLAIILQRIGGKSKNFSQNAQFAKDFLYEEICTPLSFAEEVKQLILSTNSFELPDTDLKKVTLRDLQFLRLAEDYKIFLENQNKFYHERMRFPLTRVEFYKCQLLIYKKIEKMSSIFILHFHKSRCEASARDNIKKYIEYLNVKIKGLEKEEEEEALVAGYCS